MSKQQGERRKAFRIWELSILLVVVVALFGGIVYYSESDRLQFQRVLNDLQKGMTQETTEALIAAPEGIVPQLQDMGYHCVILEAGLKHPAGAARREGCQFILTEKTLPQEELEMTGYEPASEKGDYHLYVSQMDPGEWKITQYGTVSGLQSMCYSMVSQDGKFILLDGGHEADAGNLRKLIEVFGNQVDLWICSHFHEDHIGAITAMLPDLGDITIQEIWCPPMDIDTYKSFAKEWDSVETCGKFLQEVACRKNVRRVLDGDEIKIGDLNFIFFSAYSDGAEWTHEGNNCGFIFQVKGKQETMLFCCDIGNDWISEVLINGVGERLKSDYVQMGHHGNGGLSEAAYRLVAPKAAFFDGPTWLFEDAEKYTAAKNKALMEEMGCTIYLMDDAPNSIILK